jgi:parvulin-like peptidyl-prolyl isomerase
VLHTFRKDLNKWKFILWPVLISMATSSLVMLRKSAQVSSVLTVNGDAITLRDFTARVREVQERVNQVRMQARSSGIPADLFLQMYGLTDPVQAAVDAVVYEKVVDGVLSPLWVRLHEDVVSSEILKDLPANFVLSDGSVDTAAYRRLLQYNNMNINEYEDRKEAEIMRALLDEFVGASSYSSRGARQAAIEEQLAKKSFGVAHVSYDALKKQVQDEEVTLAEKESYYETNKERYRVAEKRSFSYWVVSPSVAEKKVTVSDTVAKNFYEKNRSSLYRVPARVKVRHILVKTSSGEEGSGRSRAEEVHKKALANPESFAALAEEYSDDANTARSGGVRDFFSRGTYDKAFEQAAFRLKTPQDLSPVVKTDEGYEIIQLVERIASSEKPFDDVREEVEKAVRAKQALEWVRSHLERIKKEGPANAELVKEVTSIADSKNALNGAEEKDANTHSLEGQVIKHGFTISSIDGYGFFTQNDTHVLVQLKGKEASYVALFKDVEKRVEEDIRADRTARRVKEVAEQIQKEVSAGALLEDAARTASVSYVKSDYIRATDTKNDAFKGGGGALLKKAFSLRLPQQVLAHSSGSDVYVVTFLGSDAESDEEVTVALKNGDDKLTVSDDEGSLVSRAFTAGLIRNAHTEFDEKLLNGPQQEESIPYDV